MSALSTLLYAEVYGKKKKVAWNTSLDEDLKFYIERKRSGRVKFKFSLTLLKYDTRNKKENIV